jgi:hypothetical protein
METRSKVKGVPQGILTTSFIEEVSEALPPAQGTNPTLHKQQLVEEFPESKFPLPSETTQFHVSTEEPEHPVPIYNPASLKSPKPEPSTSTQADDLVRAIKKLGKMKSDAGNLSYSPEKIPRNSRLSSFNVNYISATWTLIVILRRLPLHYPTFGTLLKNGLNPVFPDLPMNLRNGLIIGKLSWMNFVPTSDLTTKLAMLNMNLPICV